MGRTTLVWRRRGISRRTMRWILGTFVLVVAIATPLVGPQLMRSSHLGYAVDTVRAVPVIVVLDGGGGVAEPGEDDADLLRSGVVERNGYAYLEIPPFVGEPEEWQALVECVRGHYAPFAVEITDAAPHRGPYIRVMVGGPSLDFGFDDSVHGIAPWSGEVIREAVALVFQSDDREPEHLCEIAAHEIGHSLGLDHSRNCADLMSYESCGPKAFVDEPAACGEWEDRPCTDGRRKQNSHADLLLRLGPYDPTARDVERTRQVEEVRGRVESWASRPLEIVRRRLQR